MNGRYEKYPLMVNYIAMIRGWVAMISSGE